MITDNLNVEYQTFQVNSTNDAAQISFTYPYMNDSFRYRYRIRFKALSLQFTYQNIFAPNNTVIIIDAPNGSVPITLTIPEGAYDFSTLQLWWNSQNWQGAISTLGYSSVTNRVGLLLGTKSSIDISSVANLLGSVSGIISNYGSAVQQFACTNPPQFSPSNYLLALCDGISTSMLQNGSSNAITGVIANLSLANTNPGQYLNYDKEFGGVEEYDLLNPSFTITVTDDSGRKLTLDRTLKTTICFTLCIYKVNDQLR